MEKFSFQTRRITPQRALLAAWSCWFICLLLMPVSTVFYGTFQTLVLFICANVALWLGSSFRSLSTDNSRVGAERRLYDECDLRRILLCLVAAGALAIAAKLIDMIAYRD